MYKICKHPNEYLICEILINLKFKNLFECEPAEDNRIRIQRSILRKCFTEKLLRYSFPPCIVFPLTERARDINHLFGYEINL